MNLRNIRTIYNRDLRAIVKNPIALLIAVGVTVLPALYAWVNVQACWNPYTHTSEIPVAVVNEDQSATIQDKTVNVGLEVVDNLKKNKDIKWSFVKEKDADAGIMDGTYYAEILIPKDFSKDFSTLLQDEPMKPQVLYKLNTKANPVANKITDEAKNTLVDEISTSFISMVNKTFFSFLNSVGTDAVNNQNAIIGFRNDMIDLNRNMDLITGGLQTVDERSANLSQFLSQLQAVLPNVDQQMDALVSTNQTQQTAIQSAQDTMNRTLDSISVNLSNARAEAQRLSDALSALNTSTTGMASSQISTAGSQVSLGIASLNDILLLMQNYLQVLNQQSPSADIAKMLADLQTAQAQLSTLKNTVNSLQQQAQNTNLLNSQLLNTGITQANQTVNTLVDALSLYNTTVRPTLNTIADGLYSTLNDANQMLETAHGLNQQINTMMQSAVNGSNLAGQISTDLRGRLLQYRSLIGELSEKLEQVSSSDILKIIAVLQNNPDFMSDFLSSPFDLKEQPVYPVPNYGSAMSPLYSILAIWEGTLLLLAIFRAEPKPFPGLEAISLRERFYGKMLTFITFSVIQAVIITLGNKLLVGIYTVNFPLLMVVAIVSAITFTMITYTLVALFWNFGKALSIIYLIVQVAGSGGSYPVQVDPLVFRILQPLFPFTYGLEGMREAIAGPVIERVLVDFIALFIMQACSFVFGFFLRIPLYGRIRAFKRKYQRAGIGE